MGRSGTRDIFVDFALLGKDAYPYPTRNLIRTSLIGGVELDGSFAGIL